MPLNDKNKHPPGSQETTELCGARFLIAFLGRALQTDCLDATPSTTRRLETPLTPDRHRPLTASSPTRLRRRAHDARHARHSPPERRTDGRRRRHREDSASPPFPTEGREDGGPALRAHAIPAAGRGWRISPHLSHGKKTPHLTVPIYNPADSTRGGRAAARRAGSALRAQAPIARGERVRTGESGPARGTRAFGGETGT